MPILALPYNTLVTIVEIFIFLAPTTCSISHKSSQIQNSHVCRSSKEQTMLLAVRHAPNIRTIHRKPYIHQATKPIPRIRYMRHLPVPLRQREPRPPNTRQATRHHKPPRLQPHPRISVYPPNEPRHLIRDFAAMSTLSSRMVVTTELLFHQRQRQTQTQYL